MTSAATSTDAIVPHFTMVTKPLNVDCAARRFCSGFTSEFPLVSTGFPRASFGATLLKSQGREQRAAPIVVIVITFKAVFT